MPRAGLDRTSAARAEIEAAVKQLAAAGLWPLELRALQFRASVDAYSGNYNAVWDTAVEGLRRYWNSQAAPIRAQAYEVFLELAAEGTGWNQCAVVFYRAAANSAHAAGNLEIEASNRASLAKLLHRLGEYQAGILELDAAGRLLDRAGHGEDIRDLRWETALWRVEGEIAVDTAKDPTPELKRLNAEEADKRPLDRMELAEVMGTVLRSRGDDSGAAAAFRAAVKLNQSLAESEKSWVHRQPIVEMAATSYRHLTEIEFNAGESGKALKIWQEFRPCRSRNAAIDYHGAVAERNCGVEWDRGALALGERFGGAMATPERTVSGFMRIAKL